MSEFVLKNPFPLSPSYYVEAYLKRHLFENSRYQSNRRLNRFEYQVFSKSGEDGIIEEIFNRIGVTNKFFVELGVQKGTECNTTNLLYKQWSGLWVVEKQECLAEINSSCEKILREKRLTLLHSLMTPQNISVLLKQAAVMDEPDLLSVGVPDRGYYLWRAIMHLRPRVVIVQYNALFRPGTVYVMPYWHNNGLEAYINCGASLQAFYEFATAMEYSLVGCDFTGSHAFFVRNDLLLHSFEFPYTAANHYEPPREFLFKKEGHGRKLVL